MTNFFAKSLIALKKRNITPVLDLHSQAEELVRIITPEVKLLISLTDANRLKILPFKLEKERLHCFVGGKSSYELIQELKFIAGYDITFYEREPKLIEEAIKIAYLADDQGLLVSLNSAISKAPLDNITLKNNLPEARGDTALFLGKLLEYAISKRASDLTITPRREGSLIKIRVGGEIYSQDNSLVPSPLHLQIVSRIKILSSLDTTMKSKPQDGRFSINLCGKEYGIRVGILPTLHGESIALRFIGGGEILKLDELGLASKPLALLEEALTKRRGMIIFVGPTGSGKTTTMYAAILKLLDKNLRIVTVEDPIEIEVRELTQSAVNEKQGLNYPSLLRAVLRHDPDVILVGEIRDEESAKVAFEAAYTGHLILTTTHASATLDVFPRLAQLGIKPRILAEATLLVLSQRLIPKLCNSCKVIDLKSSRELDLPAYKGVGCTKCDYSGFKGKVLISEVLKIDSSIKNLVDQGCELREALENSIISRNYTTLYESLDSAVRMGEISFEQMMEYVDRE